jgi:sigma-B regulation protein RsbU (phosphoserine phosphatase)
VIKLDITGGLVLGIVPDFEYSASKIKLEKRDGLLLYTDGVTEGINKRNRQFSEERLQACLASAKEAASGEIVKRITEEVQAFASGASQADDITVLALRYLGK